MMSCHILQILSTAYLPNTGAYEENITEDPDDPNDAVADHEDGLHGCLVDKDLLCLAAEVHPQLVVTLLNNIQPSKTLSQLNP